MYVTFQILMFLRIKTVSQGLLLFNKSRTIYWTLMATYEGNLNGKEISSLFWVCWNHPCLIIWTNQSNGSFLACMFYNKACYPEQARIGWSIRWQLVHSVLSKLALMKALTTKNPIYFDAHKVQFMHTRYNSMSNRKLIWYDTRAHWKCKTANCRHHYHPKATPTI